MSTTSPAQMLLLADCFHQLKLPTVLAHYSPDVDNLIAILDHIRDTALAS